MSSEQFSLLFYACMLIDAIGWFGFVALPRIRKLLSCKERADGIVEDVVEIKNAKGQPLFHAVVRYQAGLASYTCETVNATKAVWEKGEPAIVYYQNSKPENAFVKNAAWTGRLILGIMQSLVAVAIGIAYYVCTH